MPQTTTTNPLPRSVDKNGKATRLTPEEARIRAEAGIQALDDVLRMGDEDEQRETLDALMRDIDDEPLSDRKRFR